MTMRIAVVGAGAVGGYFGGRLARAGEDVVFIARGAHLAAMRERGLRVDSVLGDFVVHPVRATDRAADVGPVDVALVCVKAWQLPGAIETMRPLVGPQTAVVPLLNGVEAADQLQAAFGAGPVMGGLCRIISLLVGPGHIRHAAAEPYIAFGELDRRPSERGTRLREAFVRAGVRAEVPRDIHVAIWEKFLFLEPLSSLGALTRAPFGVMRAVPETRAVLERAVREIDAVGRARGIALADDTVARIMRFIDAAPADGTASMQRDLAAGRPSELEAQTGAVVRLGREAEVPTPVHEVFYAALAPGEARARGAIAFAPVTG